MPGLSDEQARAVRRACSGREGAVVARAGSGKTHTLRAIAARLAPRDGLLLAFNRRIAADAAARLPPNVRATTIHALAFRQVLARDPRLRRKFAAGGGRIPTPAWIELAALAPDAPGVFTHVAHLRAVMASFCASAATRPCRHHLPPSLARRLVLELGPDRARDRQEWLARRTARVWERVTDPADPAPLDHDVYLKLFAAAGAALDVDVLLVDEAQDLAPVMLMVLDRQHGQRILVGDPAQRIYGWRGAVDAMAASKLPVVRLTRSFRFGPEIAAAARRVLAVVDRHSALTGSGAAGRVRLRPLPADAPRTLLCRSNAGLVDAALALGQGGLHVVGGIRPMTSLLRAAHALRSGAGDGRSSHPDLAGIRDWKAFGRAAEAEGGSLRTLYRLVERHGGRTPAICRALEAAQTRREEDAVLVLSTVHKAKGREWDRVELWSDLPRVPPDHSALASAPDPEAARAEANLLYVAATRARRELGLGRTGEDVRSLLSGEASAA